MSSFFGKGGAPGEGQLIIIILILIITVNK